jgi:outer membrane protein assembly factor BamB
MATLALAATGLVWLGLQPELENNLKGWMTVTVVLLATVVIILWAIVSRRFSGKTRAYLVLGLLGAVGAGFALLRVDGTIDGRGLPKFVWRWQQARKLALPPAPSVPAPGADPRLALARDTAQFFGPNRDGVIRGIHLAQDWQAQPPKELWRQPIGSGWSAFAVVGARIFTQEQRGEEELVTCYDLFTGALRWAHRDPAHFTQWQGGDGPRATPTVVEGRVFTYGATGLLNCLDAETGGRVWSRAVLTENQLANIEWGTSASPLVFDEKVVVTGGATVGPVLFAYHRETGALLWKAGHDQASYASPILATLAGRRMILSNNAASLTAHDPASGEVLFEQRWGIEKWPKASQPLVIDGDRIFLSAGYGMGCQLLKISAEADGKLRAEQVWKGLRMKTQFNSAVVRDGCLYGLDDGGLSCVDLSTGERLWKGGRYGSGQSLLVDDLILVQSEPGPVVLALAQKSGHRELGRIPALSSKTWNFPTLAGRYLLLRNDREAVCYELPVPPEAVNEPR